MSEKVPTVLDLQTVANIAGDLPALPGSAMAAMKLADNPKVNARELQAVIARDQALTARILKICNSAMFCFEREVATLSHAIAILGLDKVRSIIVAATVQQMFQADATSGKDLTTRLFWEHSWGAAVAARALAVCHSFSGAGGGVYLRIAPRHGQDGAAEKPRRSVSRYSE